MDKGFADLSVKRQAEASLDGVGIGMGGSQFLGGALDVGTHVLELGGYLLLEGELLEVDGVVGVGGDGRVGVLLPGEGLRPADDDLDTVVLDRAGEVLTQAFLGDDSFYCLLHVLAQAVHGGITLVGSDLCCEKLVDDRVVGSCLNWFDVV